MEHRAEQYQYNLTDTCQNMLLVSNWSRTSTVIQPIHLTHQVVGGFPFKSFFKEKSKQTLSHPTALISHTHKKAWITARNVKNEKYDAIYACTLKENMQTVNFSKNCHLYFFLYLTRGPKPYWGLTHIAYWSLTLFLILGYIFSF